MYVCMCVCVCVCVYIYNIFTRRVYVHKTIACTDRYARRWIETVGGSSDCMPRGSASRSDTIVIGKPISSTRNIPARYPGCFEPGGSLIPISTRLRPFYETPRLLSIGLTVSPSELKNMFTVFPVSLFSPLRPSFLSHLPLFSTPSTVRAAPHAVKTS